MRNTTIVLVFALMLSGCEIFHIGSNKAVRRQIDFDQKSAMGAVYLFITELDSNNPKAATVLIAQPGGKYYLAIDKYDMYEEITRLGNLISNTPVTGFKTDTISESNQRIQLELDYLKSVVFSAKKIKNSWFITDYAYTKNNYNVSKYSNSDNKANLKHGN